MGEAPEYRIEEVAADDAELVAPLFDAYREFYKCEPDSPRALAYLRERLAKGDSTIFAAVEGEGAGRRAIGFTQLYPTWESLDMGKMYVLYDLFVDSTVRRRGVGRALLDRAVGFARKNGAVVVLLETAKDNVHAKGLYESAGWTLDEQFDTYHFELG
jgi:ribosomal protein S18 acetylase RimI-like enzyme